MRPAGIAVDKQFTADLTVAIPYNGTPTYRGISSSTTLPAGPFPRLAHVIGIIEKFEWQGGARDPISIDFWVSRETATTIRNLQHSMHMATKVDALGWWICDYDHTARQWFEVSYPESRPTITGMIGPKANPELSVDLTGLPAKDGIGVMVYKVSISVLPAANSAYALRFASSAATTVIRPWGG